MRCDDAEVSCRLPWWKPLVPAPYVGPREDIGHNTCCTPHATINDCVTFFHAWKTRQALPWHPWHMNRSAECEKRVLHRPEGSPYLVPKEPVCP